MYILINDAKKDFQNDVENDIQKQHFVLGQKYVIFDVFFVVFHVEFFKKCEF